MNAVSKKLIGLSLIVMLSLEGCLAADSSQMSLYNGCSDPSTATSIDNQYFVTGDDEINILRVYSIEGSADPGFSLDISDSLKVDAEHPEADIEASARIGQRIYWITSHGRNKDGKVRPSRYRLFATDIQNTDPNRPPQITFAGKAYSALISDMLACPALNKLKLQDVTRLEEPLTKKQQAQLAPKKKGLNIEGLAVGPDGQSLWIALRNPLYSDVSGKMLAIVIPLLNPAQVIEEGQKARFGEPLLLDLDGRGIRSMDFQEDPRQYWITAGSVASQGDFAFYCYRLGDQKPVLNKVEFPKNFTPEGVVGLSDRQKICFISDDGTLLKTVQSPVDCMESQLLPDGTCPNKYLVDINQRSFRLFWVDRAVLQK